MAVNADHFNYLDINIIVVNIIYLLSFKRMSRLSSTLTKHRKDNYSLDIKGIYKNTALQTPFVKKRESNSQFFYKLKTQVAHNTSMQSTEKETEKKPKRRFSLTKPLKMNQSIGIENQVTKEKIKKINQLLFEEKYQECLNILRQLLTREDNQFFKNRLYWLNATCLAKLGKIKQSEHYLTRLLNEEQDNYEALVERAKIRYILGARQLSIRDLKNAIYLEPSNQKAYLELCQLYLNEGDDKQAFGVANLGIQKNVRSKQILLNIIQMLLTNKSLTLSSEQKAIFYVKKLNEQIGKQFKQSADLMYIEGLLCEVKDKINEACIFYEQCLKFNNSKWSVTKSIQKLIWIKIAQRDYYSAYHTLSRYRILCVDNRVIIPYLLFLEGVVLIMKKKYFDGIRLFDNLIQVIETKQASEKNQILFHNILKQLNQQKISKQKIPFILNQIQFRCKQVILPLMLKFNSYACFKTGHHDKCIQYYGKLSQWGLDQCSSYNLLLAQGILAVQRKKNFQLGMQKFQQARYVYPCKVEPCIYIAMTVIYRDLCLSGVLNNQKEHSETLDSAIIHAMQQLNEAHETINNSSSNLLYHRCILNLYIQDSDAALSDINLCIQKAQENEPKYFYLRGLCYAVIKDFKKSVNQYSISLSLDSQHQKSLLERAKCYFLMGQTQHGFADLKQYMLKNQNDYYVHKWIGDLLYEGRSYSDAFKAYSEIADNLLFEAQIMKCKCLLRMSDLNKVSDCLTKLTKLQDCKQNLIQVDILAVSLLKILTKPHQNKELSSKIKKLNALLESNCTGYIFGLIDCMTLLGIATFDIGKYEEAYESFNLIIQLYSTLAEKNRSQIKSDFSEQGLNLTLQDVYLNILLCLIGMKDYDSAERIIKHQLIPSTQDEMQVQLMERILSNFENQESGGEIIILEPENKKNQKIKLKEVTLKMKNIKIKSSPIFALFHIAVEDLYSKSVTKKMIRDLKPSYIDNMPEGPWIKRNEHGVVFTDQMIQDSGTSDFLSTMRVQSQSSQLTHQNIKNLEEDDSESRKREEFKKKMLLDQQLQRRLNKIIKKTNEEA